MARMSNRKGFVTGGIFGAIGFDSSVVFAAAVRYCIGVLTQMLVLFGFVAKLVEWERFYNLARPHDAFDGKTPYEALRERL